MSYDQDYNVPSIESLLERLVNKSSWLLLREELEKYGITIVKQEEVVLDNGFYQEVKGTKVTLSDGRVFVPKLVEKFSANGNYGRDTYEYVLESETPEVKYTGNDVEDDKEGKQDYIEATENFPIESNGELEEDKFEVENDGG